MTVDDLTAPLRREPNKRRRAIKIPVPQIIAGALAAFLGLFALWAVVTDDPFGGEPMAVVPANLRVAVKTSDIPAPPQPQPSSAATEQHAASAAASASPPGAAAPPNTTTITIIDGKTGGKQEVVIPAPASGTAPPQVTPLDQKFVEMTPQGAIPRIAADGTRPADAFARAVQPLPGKPDAPRIALIVGGLGVSASGTASAISKLPAAVTLGFVPYGADVATLAARARSAGHEILLQVPMEPFEYPDNDPGPQTLLTSLTPEQNIDRLHWVMGRFQGYVGLANTMGARFTASENVLCPDPARDRQTRIALCRRRHQPEERCRAHRRRRQSAVRASRRDPRFGAEPHRDRPRAGPPGNGGARAQCRGRHRVRAAGVD